MTRILLLIALVGLGVVPVAAQESGLTFLRIGANATSSAMGDGGVAYSRDAFSTYWNPAGLAAGTSNSAALSHIFWIADARIYALGGRFGAGENGGFGLFLNATSVGDIPERSEPGDPDGFFDVQFINFGVAYGRQFGPLSLGVGIKYLSERIYVDDATGYAVDVGARLVVLDEAVQVGAALQNLGEMDELDVVATPLPRMMRAGIAVQPFRIITAIDGADVLNLLLNAEVSHVIPDEQTRVHIGAAAQVLDIIRVRAGFITNDAFRSGPTFGAGLDYSPLEFDYAFIPFADGFGSGHALTVSYAW